MRRRLALLSLATTTFLVIAFLVPLGLLVRRQAADRARIEAERQAQALASLIALAVTLDAAADTVAAAIGPLSQGVMVVLPDGSVLGEPLPAQGTLVEGAAEDQATIASLVEGGWEIALPVIGRAGVSVVDVYVPDKELSEGVAGAWALLGLLGLVLVGTSVVLADRLGRRLVEPTRQLALAAHRLGEGDLDVRVDVADPPEFGEVGEAFNRLAGRLEQLLVQEREELADLSHRLRTPLTSLRLQAESIVDPEERQEMVAQVDRLEQSIDQLIVAARTRGRSVVGRCSLDEVVDQRAAFWRILADEEQRELSLELGAQGVELGISAEEVEAVVDTLVGNVFAHTEPETSLTIATGETGNRPWIEVADEGPGFTDESLLDRGVSGAGSTGLGLDIVRRTAEMTGGEIEMNNRPSGGAVVRVWFG